MTDEELIELRNRVEVELKRGEEWCRDFIAMRKQRDALVVELRELQQKYDVQESEWAAEMDRRLAAQERAK